MLNHEVSSTSVLILEDDGVAIEVETRVLLRAGFRVKSVSTVSEALALLTSEAFLVVVLGYNLPGEEPWRVVEIAKAQVPSVPVILVTSSGNEYIATEAVRRGVAAYMKKEDELWEHLPGTVQRVARQAQTEQNLRRADALLNLIASNTSDLITVVNPDGIIRYVSPACRYLLGYEPEELVGRQGLDFVHPDDRDSVAVLITRLPTDTQNLAAYRHQKRCKDYVWVESNVTAFADPESQQIKELVVISRDISARRKAERALRESELRFRALFEGSPVSLWEADWSAVRNHLKASSTAGIDDFAGHLLSHPELVHDLAAMVNLIQVNDAAKRMFGAESTTQLRDTISSFLRAPGSSFFRDTICALLAGATTVPAETTLNTSSGQELIVNTRVTVPAGFEESWERIITSIFDVTELTNAKEALAEKNQRLLEQTARAEEASAAKSAFLAQMSHEIRTPMNSILGMSEVLAGTDLSAKQKQYVQVFQRAGSSLLVLIDDLLDLSKIEGGHLQLECVQFDLEELLDHAVELLAPSARAKNLNLLCRLSPGTSTKLMGDPVRLRQILVNLVGNAVKFTSDGGILIAVESRESPEDIRFSVSDTGIGIPADKLQMIFDNFSQADHSTTRRFGGTGLGLSISRKIVEKMGGNLTVESTEGVGSTFEFSLRFEAAMAGTAEVLSELQGLTGQSVLLIDDNPISRLIHREMLAVWGLDIQDLTLPDEALEALTTAARRYSLAIIVSQMTAIDSFETARRLHAITPELPIILICGDQQPHDAAQELPAGISGYAITPVRRTHLLRLVSQALHSSPGQDPTVPDLSQARKEVKAGANPLNILVADDLSDNRLLILAYLETSPHRLTFVEDGKEAVERFASEDFDLVLMDIQMPVMDGLAATRSIRALENQRSSRKIPIIALSASASKRDVEMSSAAGCTAHLSKPLSKQNLLSAIAEHRMDPGDRFSPAEATPEVLPSLQRLVPKYVEGCRRRLSEMRTAFVALDFDRIRKLAHDMKGSGAPYGFPHLTELGTSLEHLAGKSDHAGVQTNLGHLSDYLGRIALPGPAKRETAELRSPGT